MDRTDADLRPWLAGHSSSIDPYTARRIAESYDLVDSVLQRCVDLRTRTALDVGSGPGFDSFALGTHFDRVVAIDVRRRSVRAARGIAKRAGVRRVHFIHADAQSWGSKDRRDFVWCNAMSHNGASRRRLIERLRGGMDEGGWLFYSEECEGYPALELDAAIQRRDGRALIDRLRQVVNGVCGRPGFRFFFSGTVRGQLERLGFRVRFQDKEDFNGLVYLERTWAVAHESSGPGQPHDLDYDDLPPEVLAVRALAREAVRYRRHRFDPHQRASLRAAAEANDSVAAPFLYLLLAADLVPLAFDGQARPLEQARHLLRVHPTIGERIWGEVAELYDDFAETLRSGPIPVSDRARSSMSH